MTSAMDGSVRLRYLLRFASELVPGATPAVELQFKNLVLQEFQNSPKWEEKGIQGEIWKARGDRRRDNRHLSEVTQ